MPGQIAQVLRFAQDDKVWECPLPLQNCISRKPGLNPQSPAKIGRLLSTSVTFLLHLAPINLA